MLVLCDLAVIPLLEKSEKMDSFSQESVLGLYIKGKNQIEVQQGRAACVSPGGQRTVERTRPGLGRTLGPDGSKDLAGGSRGQTLSSSYHRKWTESALGTGEGTSTSTNA